jgi:hypothetical protein
MAATHTVRAAELPGTATAAPSDRSTAIEPADRVLWLEVGIASILGATAGLLGTWAIVATQTLQMHF